MTAEQKIEAALEIARLHAQTDGAHHKTWCIDQMVRALTGDNYSRFITGYRGGEDGPETYNWDEGTPP